MSIDARLALGETFALGAHVFGADEIKAFAARYDPQRFHLDEEEARRSVFGSLCASGWHTAAMWLRYNVLSFPAAVERSRAVDGRAIEFGPAAGLRELKWLKPVYVGDTIAFARTAESHRALASRPGWRMLTSRADASNQDGAPVMTFRTLVMVRAD